MFLLLIIFKVIEKIVHDQTIHFYQRKIFLYNLWIKSNYGFRRNHSTNLCLAHLAEKKLKGFYEGLLTGMIRIDPQAFVTKT